MLTKKLRIALLIVLLVNVIGIRSARGEERTRITLKDGIIEGKQAKTVDKGKTYYSFQGVPYAKPPLGDLRFAPPQPPEKRSTILDATKPANTCIETPFPGSGHEDCLYLNVYTPALDRSLPVIVWIHGGGFTFVFYHYTLNGTDFFMDEDVIFVTINYRLGVFGFLSTEDDVIPGNYGLKDMVAAISWVHDNIAAFGGDPKKITVMGQSAGATSTGYFGIVPQLKGKIAGIIQQSGSALCPFSLGRYHRVGAYVLSTRMGLQTQNSSAILQKLREVDAEDLRRECLVTYIDITSGTDGFKSQLYTPGLETRAIDNPLITEMSHRELKKGHFNKIPRMIGINSVEGVYMIETFQTDNKTYQNYDQMLTRYIPLSMNSRSEAAGYWIKQHYTGGAPFVSNVSNMVHYGSDDQFVRPILQDASLVSKYVPTYVYEFSYEGKLGNPGERPIRGVSHGEELAYLFYDKNQGNVSETDRLVRRKLVRLWSNFAKYGNPTPNKDKILDDRIWQPVKSDRNDFDYMDIGEKLVARVNPHRIDVKFWNDLFAKYGNPPFDTY